MEIRIKDLNIKQYRHLNDVSLKDCSTINLILGDNNVGKTAVLESINLLSSPSPENMLSVGMDRDPLSFFVKPFVYLFPIGKNRISIDATTNEEQTVSFEATYSEREIETTYAEVEKRFKKHLSGLFLSSSPSNRSKQTDNFPLRLDVYTGEVKLNGLVTPFEYVGAPFRYFPTVRTKNYANIRYVSPFRHFNFGQMELNRVLKKNAFEALFLEVLRMFDETITGIRYLPLENNVSSAEMTLCIDREGHDPEPVYIYGDGIKKTMMLASEIINASNGILLLDEIETSLHHTYFKDLFLFLVRAAKKFNVQIFATTHSAETIRTILDIDEEMKESARIYTLLKRNGKVYCRGLGGEEARNLTENYNLELRN